MAVIVWKELGFGIIVFLARLMSVSEEMYEAARDRRRGLVAAFRHVTLPQLVPAIVFFAVVETITMLSWVFAYIYVMTAGGPGQLDGRHASATSSSRSSRTAPSASAPRPRVTLLGTREPPHRGCGSGRCGASTSSPM